MDAAGNIEYPAGCQPISATDNHNELIKKLKALHTALKDECSIEEGGRPNRYQGLVLYLVEPQFLDNPNRDIRILLACSIAKLFHIFAPESPIVNPEILRDVLLFLARNLDGLSEPKSLQYHWYFYLLELLYVTETMQLALQLSPDATQQVLRQLIKTGFGAMNEKNTREVSLGALVTSITSKLVQNVKPISNCVLDAVLYFIVDPQKTNNRDSYRIARNLITSNKDILESPIQALLSDGCKEGELPDCDLITAKKLFHVVTEIHEFEPELVYPIIQMLIAKLEVSSVPTRLDATTLFGNLISSPKSRLAEEYPELWGRFKLRFNDSKPKIRIICVKSSENMLIFHKEVAGQVSDLLMDRCTDLEEQVRLETVKMVTRLATKDFTLVSEKLLECVAGRTRDKKMEVRHETVKSLCRLFRSVYANETLAESEKASILMVFKAIIGHYCRPLQQDRIQIEKMFVFYLVPYKVEVDKRMQVLLDTFLCCSTAFTAQAYQEILGERQRMHKCIASLLDLIEKDDNMEDLKKEIDVSISALAECCAEPAKATLTFQTFVEFLQSDIRALQDMKYLYGDMYECDKIDGYLAELVNRLKSRGIKLEDISTIRNVLGRSAPLQIDQEAINVLLYKVDALMQKAFLIGDDTAIAKVPRLNALLKVMAENRPNCFRGETMLLLLEKMLDYDHKPTVENTLKVIKLVGKPLTSSSGTQERNCHERLLESCSYISKRGSTLAAKYAVRALVALMGHDKAGDLVDGIVENALEHIGLDDPLCGTAFKALGSAVEAYPEKYKDRFMDLILTNVIGTVLNENLNEYQKVGEDGILEDELDREAKKALYDSESAKQKLGPKCVARLMALRFIGVFCTSQSLYVDQGLEGLAKQFLDLLLNTVDPRITNKFGTGDLFVKRIPFIMSLQNKRE